MTPLDDTRGIVYEAAGVGVRATMRDPFGRAIKNPFGDVDSAASAYSRVSGMAIQLVRADGTMVPYTPGTLANSARGAYGGIAVSIRGLTVIDTDAPRLEWDSRKHVPRLDTEGRHMYFFAGGDNFTGEVPGVGHVRSLSRTTWTEQEFILLPPSDGSVWHSCPDMFIASLPVSTILLIQQFRTATDA